MKFIDDYKKTEIDFEPIKDRNEHLRGKFWDSYAEKFVDIGGALSSATLLNGELRLCKNFLQKKKKGGKFLKLDLWNEVFHTPIIDHIWKGYDEVHGIDIAPGIVKKARRNLKKKGIPLNTKVGDIRKLPYKNNYFDFVYTMGTIEHIPHPFDAMKEIYRVLKPGGSAVIGVPNKYEWFGKSLILELLAVTGFNGNGLEHSYSWKKLTAELKACGFQITAKTGLYFMPWFIRLLDWFFYQRSPRFKYLLFIPIKICDYLSKIEFLRKNGGSILAVAATKPKDE